MGRSARAPCESLQLDPRNPILLSESALTNRAVRNFKEARELVDRALELEPTSSNLLAQKAEIQLARGDLTSATQLIERMPFDPQDATVFGAHVRAWMMEGQIRRGDRRLAQGAGYAG